MDGDARWWPQRQHCRWPSWGWGRTLSLRRGRHPDEWQPNENGSEDEKKRRDDAHFTLQHSRPYTVLFNSSAIDQKQRSGGAISHRAGLWVYGVKKKRAAAFKHLTDAKRILSQFGQTPILGRVDAALAELGQ
jgi:hypothetical protein